MNQTKLEVLETKQNDYFTFIKILNYNNSEHILSFIFSCKYYLDTRPLLTVVIER